MPRGRCLPSTFGMYRRRTTLGRYSPARSAAASSSRKRSTPYCSTSRIDWPSIPAAPRFPFTRLHASSRTSPLQMWSYSAWKRLPGARLAAHHSRRCSCCTLSRGLRPPGSLGPVLPAIPLRLPAPPTRPPQGPFPPAAFFFTTFVRSARAKLSSTTVPSDSRCAAHDFAFGLYVPPCPDEGCADGSLVFRASPCTRAASHTPSEPTARFGSCAADFAFAVT